MDVSSLEYLRSEGFSERMIDDFYRPFYGGIFLDRSLSTSSRVLRFTFKMLATGKTAVPARGIGEIPKQLAAHLPVGAVRTNSPVRSLLREGDRVVGVEAAGEEHEADAVVVATEAPVAGRLAGAAAPEGSVGQLCVYYAASGFGEREEDRSECRRRRIREQRRGDQRRRSDRTPRAGSTSSASWHSGASSSRTGRSTVEASRK